MKAPWLALALTFLSSSAAFADEPVELKVGGAQITVEMPEPGTIARSRAELTQWVSRAACAVTAYYGRFPVKRFRIRLEVQEGISGVPGGSTYSEDGALSIIRVGARVSVRELEHDWVMTHEMVHLAMPRLPDAQHWMEEGMATYVEPIARLYVGNEDANDVWQQLVDGLPRGLPEPGDRGLDHTSSWGSTYWGGALYCLVAEVRIRKLTQNKLGLRDALRAITDAGGSIVSGWTLERTLSVADARLPSPVLRPLYLEMKDKPYRPNLAELFTSLGVSAQRGQVHLLDTAPDAAVRRSITATSGVLKACP